MIELFAEGIVSDVQFTNAILRITLKLGRSRCSPRLIGTVKGGLAQRLRRRIRPGQELLVHGMPVTPIAEIAIDSVMNISSLPEPKKKPVSSEKPRPSPRHST